MNNTEFSKELRLKNGPSILGYIKSFSITEKTVFGLFVLVAGISALLMAISVSNAFMKEIPARGGEFTEAMVGLPHMINPVLAITDADRDISALVYSGLTKYDGENIVPDLAESYNISDDGLTYSFKLRPNIFFHDGAPVTADDIAYTIQKVQNAALKSPRRADWNNVSVTIVSPKEIKFTLKQAYSPFISNTTIGIIPKHIWNNLNDDQFIFSQYNIEPIGSGPYKLKSIVRDDGGIPKEYKLEAFEKYHNRRAYIDRINIVFFPDSDKAISALKNGSVDSFASISSKQAKAFNLEKDYSVISTPLPRIFGVFFNQSQNPILADRNVRQALDLAVDRLAIINSTLDGYGLPLHGPLPFGMSTAKLDIISSNKSNLDLAKSILEKSGWVKNQTTGIYEKKGPKNVLNILSFDLVTSDTPDLKQTAEMIKESWNALGAKVEVKIFDSSELYQNIIRPRKYDTLLFGQLIGKDRDLYAFWHSSQRNSPGLNVAMYANSKADDILESIRSANDELILKSKYSELDQVISTDIPAIFLYSPDFIYVLPKILENADIKNMTIPSDRWSSITNWYMRTERVWGIFADKK